jgi:hypothetical protein
VIEKKTAAETNVIPMKAPERMSAKIDATNMSAELAYCFLEITVTNMTQYISPHIKSIEKKDSVAKKTKIRE